MNHPEDQSHIQAARDIGDPPDLSEGAADLSSAEGTIAKSTLVAGTVFGAIVGLLMGAIAGAVCCWLSGQFDLLWNGVLCGVVAGPFAGAAIGLMERNVRGDLTRPDVATFAGVVFGLIPVPLVGLGLLGGVRGKLSGFMLIGSIFAGPMTGLVIGGILDRAFEELLKKSWRRAAGFGAAGIAVCLGALYLIDGAAYGPDPEVVGKRVQSIIYREWADDPKLKEWEIQNLKLVRNGRTKYSGFADATFLGRRKRLELEAVVEGGTVWASWSMEAERD